MRDKDCFIGVFEERDITIKKEYLDAEEKYTRLYHTRYTPENPKKTLCIVHGFGEHSGRFETVARYFASQEFDVLTIDLRGFGFSGAARGTATLEQMQNDVIRMLKQVNPNLPLFLYGHSLGGLIVLRFLLERPELKVGGCIITSPLLGFPKDRHLPWLKVFLLKQIGGDLDDVIINSMVNPTALTKNNNYMQTIFQDRLMIPFLSIKMAKSILQSVEFVNKHLTAFTVPMLVFHGKLDSVTNFHDSQRLVYTKTSAYKQLHLFQEGYHELQHDCEKDQMLRRSVDFINALPTAMLKAVGPISVPLFKKKQVQRKLLRNMVILVILVILIKRVLALGASKKSLSIMSKLLFIFGWNS